jgi:phosphotransferase system enzyme I (PtsP)
VQTPTGESLLLALRDVSDIVSNSHDLRETFSNIVELIERRFHTDVCSIYSFEKSSGMLLLRATRGLKPDCIDRTRLAPTEGLVGLAFERREPVNVSDAFNHPRFRYFPELGEEGFPTFLGVPLIHGGAVLGVLVIQRRDPTPYAPSMASLLVGVAAQLATLISNARLTQELFDSLGQLKRAEADETKKSELHGTGACPGLGYGKAMVFEPFEFSDPRLVARPPGALAEERERLQNAVARAKAELQSASEHIAELLGEDFGAIMQAQRVLLEDKSVQRQLSAAVEAGASVEQAVVKVGGAYLRAFERLDNPMFHERMYDIKDVFRRVMDNAVPGAKRLGPEESTIVVASEVSLLELFASDVTRVRGIVVERGGAFSHVAILARSLGVPMITQTHKALDNIVDNDEVFVDASAGLVVVNPDPERRRVLLELLASRRIEEEEPTDGAALPVRLEATVNLLPEATRTVERGADGIGLYRSEFLQLARRTVPSEEEQFDVYRKLATMLGGRPLTIRTLDLRADKLFRVESDQPVGANWEWRLVDESPAVQELIRVQLRAILRAADHGAIRILFPMIATERQLRCALRLVDEAKRSLQAEGLSFAERVPIGIMIEVPAAVMMLRRWVEAVDFLGVGSNDLLHALLGIDRDSDSLAHLKTPLEPTYLRAVRHVVKQGRGAGKPVTVCGEAASYPRAALALAAIGVTGLSVPPDHLPKVRREFARVRLPHDLDHVGRRLAAAGDIQEVERILDQAFPAIGGSSA